MMSTHMLDLLLMNSLLSMSLTTCCCTHSHLAYDDVNKIVVQLVMLRHQVALRGCTPKDAPNPLNLSQPQDDVVVVVPSSFLCMMCFL